eukprot:Phypoly_transcript_06764.p1 GENE.Phypoly_transcript_06764~~Phypoly_transcript_06764.p1  ORF type:complete len:361 (+),score=50.92 Phypoly_transcript_06764:118-1200(+)
MRRAWTLIKKRLKYGKKKRQDKSEGAIKEKDDRSRASTITITSPINDVQKMAQSVMESFGDPTIDLYTSTPSSFSSSYSSSPPISITMDSDNMCETSCPIVQFDLFLLERIRQMLNKRDVIAFSMTCRSIQKQLCPFISPNCVFKWEYSCQNNYYTPASIKFGDSFNKSVDTLPAHLSTITFGDQFNQPVNNLPSSTLSIVFGAAFNQSVDNLPSSLTRVKFGHDFNQPVNNLPAGLTHLTFGQSFNQPVDHLPSSITHIFFGFSFNLPVDNLPPNLVYLSFGTSFNQPVNHLPHNLKQLIFRYRFNQPLDDLPPNLVKLCLGESFKQSTDKLPATITNLSYGRFVQTEIFSKLLDFNTI